MFKAGHADEEFALMASSHWSVLSVAVSSGFPGRQSHIHMHAHRLGPELSHYVNLSGEVPRNTEKVPPF